MMSTAVPIVRASGEGDKQRFYGGGVHTWKATIEETGGSLFVFEDLLSEGKMTPLHRHPEADETVYVLEGEILVQLDGHQYPVGPGGMTFAPRGVPHTFLVTSPVARLLCMQTPGTGQAFYRGASEPMTAGDDATDTVDFARVRASAEQNGGVDLLGPPPFAAP